MTSNLLRVSEVAELLGQNEKTVRGKIDAGVLPGIRIGDGPRSPFRIPADELEDWLHDRKPPAQGRASLAARPSSGLEEET